MYKGVVFDLDGTLVESPLCFKSIREHLDIPEGALILEYLDGLPLHSKTVKLLELEKIEITAARGAFVFPGVTDLIRELRSLNIKLGIFTRNCRAATQHIVTMLGLSLDLILTREDAPPKPDPTGLREFLRVWDLSQADLLFVGDSKFDIECGHRAGVKTALFTKGKNVSETWGAHHLIPHFSQFWVQISAGS